MGRKPCFRQIVLMRFFCEGQIPIVDIQVIVVVVTFQVACITHINV